MYGWSIYSPANDGEENSKRRENAYDFIDLERAYDSVPRNRMWRTLQEYNIDNCLIEVIKELYADNR
jgi:hypothetical protein